MAGIRLVCKLLGKNTVFCSVVFLPQVFSMILHSSGQTGCGGLIQKDSAGYEAGKIRQLNWYSCKWKNHFSEMKGDVGMSPREKKGSKKMFTPRKKLIYNPIPTSLFMYTYFKKYHACLQYRHQQATDISERIKM